MYRQSTKMSGLGEEGTVGHESHKSQICVYVCTGRPDQAGLNEDEEEDRIRDLFFLLPPPPPF